MRQDECYFFNTDVVTLYNGYLRAAQEPPFERSCKEEPYHTITFGVNFSFKYNFNGGSCIMRFIPYQGGAAVNLRFVLAQGAAGRTGRYAQDLTDQAVKYIGAEWHKSKIDVELFTLDENKVVQGLNSTVYVPPVPQPSPEPVVEAVPVYTYTPVNEPVSVPVELPKTNPMAEEGIICLKCGRKMPTDAAFCSSCGSALAVTEKFCSKCGTKALEDAVFCHACGNRL